MAQFSQNKLALVKWETISGVDANPNPLDDAIQVTEAMPTVNTNAIQRTVLTGDFSPTADMMGSKTQQIVLSVEVKGNRLQQSGLLEDMPVLARLFGMCGRQTYATTGTACIHAVVADHASSPAAKKKVTWAKGVVGVAPTVPHPVVYEVEVVTGGVSGVAEYRVRENLEADSAWSGVETLESDMAIDLGASGASIIPTFTGAVAAGDVFRVVVTPAAIVSKPISRDTEHKTGTIYLYMDGTLHKMTASIGTFSISAEAGGVATVQFTFSGNYIEPIDAAMPDSSVLDDENPPQVELSNLWFGKQKPVGTASWSFDTANAVTRRPDVNEREGTRSFKITGRAPVGGFTPDSDIPSRDPVWDLLATGAPQFFSTRIGQESGNVMFFYGPRAQVTNVSYTDRDGTMGYDKSLKFTRHLGDDESIFVFC